MKVVPHATLDGAFTFQLIVPRRHPKMALDGGHYLLADEKRWTRLVVDGKERDLLAMVKIWAPVDKADMAEAARVFRQHRIRKNSPMLW